MSTRACIAIQLHTGIYKCVYCHHSPILDDLIKYFPTENDASELIGLGSLSIIEKNGAVAFFRDLHHPIEQTHPKYKMNFDRLLDHANDIDAEHLFYFQENHWQYEKI